MRPLFLFALFAGLSTVQGQQFIASVTDGPWHDPTTWDCSCIPGPDDNVSVFHEVSIGQDVLHGLGLIYVPVAGSIVSSAQVLLRTSGPFDVRGSLEVPRLTLLDAPLEPLGVNFGTVQVTQQFRIARDQFENIGIIQASDTLFSTTTWTNEGTVSVNDLVGAGQVFNNGVITGTGQFRGACFNEGSIEWMGTWDNLGGCYLSGSVVIDGPMTVGNGVELVGSLEVNGELLVQTTLDLDADTAYAEVNGDLTVLGTLQGSGVLCVSDTTNNLGTITGTLDVCDITRTATMAPFLDLNAGTVGPDVVFCDNPFCAPNTVPEEEVSALHIAPNVGPGPFRIGLMVPSGSVELEIMDALGRSVQRSVIRGERALTWDASGVDPGRYLVFTRNADGTLIASGAVVVLR
ncbi:MAG: hypothetical protein KDB88_09085 [Flavobacteriales bacterium]|nr:hypothetical protein [Flavobacteriales bacterium]